MILHAPWSRDLGISRVSIEVADEFQREGIVVDKYDINDAFPRRTYWNMALAMPLFSRRARQYVRQNGHKYDVIQAEQGNLPYSKQELGYHRLLVARSNGLAHFHERWERENEPPPRSPLRRLAKRLHNADTATRSFQTADAIILINQDEYNYTVNELGFRDKAYLFHNGMSQTRLQEFCKLRALPAQRQHQSQIAFIGHWNPRKGALDMPRILRQVRKVRPQTRLLLLGIGKSSEEILPGFATEDRDRVEVMPNYRSDALPSLLSQATVGVFPSYMEGFGIGVLELLAAGVPTVAYDVPGPREMLTRFSPPLLVPSGDVDAMAQRLTELLSLQADEYARFSEQSCEIAMQFQWQDVAAGMLSMYRERLAKLNAIAQGEASIK